MRDVKISIKNALKVALIAATPEENLREVGHVAFNEAIINGNPLHETLVQVLDQVAAEATTWQDAMTLFYAELKAQEGFLQLAALQTMLETVTDDIPAISNARVTFINATANGSTLEEALALVLDQVAEDDTSWAIAEQVFYDRLENLEYPGQAEEEEEVTTTPARKIMKVAAIAIGLILLTFLAFAIGSAWMNSQKVEKPVVEAPVTTETTTEVPNRDDAIIAAMNVMTKAGWKPGEFIIDTVDEEADASTTGNGAFTNENIKNPSAMTGFLVSGTDAANALLAKLMKDTGATKEEVLNDLNWVSVQSNIPFVYPGNTGFKKNEVVDTGSRTGNDGDIFLFFVAPNGNEPQTVRGACANPQTVVPKPEPPEVPPTTTPDTPDTPDTPELTPKSPNKNDYEHPITKPVVPTVITKPEVTPPVVDKSEIGPSGITDRPTKDPGMESGVTAPGATPSVPDRSDAVPPAEIKVNPANDGTNIGDPGNPF